MDYAGKKFHRLKHLSLSDAKKRRSSRHENLSTMTLATLTRKDVDKDFNFPGMLADPKKAITEDLPRLFEDIKKLKEELNKENVAVNDNSKPFDNGQESNYMGNDRTPRPIGKAFPGLEFFKGTACVPEEATIARCIGWDDALTTSDEKCGNSGFGCCTPTMPRTPRDGMMPTMPRTPRGLEP